MTTRPDDAQVIFENAVVRRATTGDADAFVTLGSLHAQKLYSIARNLSSSEAEAMELMQQALQEAYDQIARLPAELSFRAFVCRFAVRNAIGRLRRAGAPETEWPACAPPARREEFAERIRDALERLDPEDRAAFVLRVVEDLPVDEVAAIQETTVAAVRARAHQASLLLAAYVQHLLAQSITAEMPALTTWIQ